MKFRLIFSTLLVLWISSFSFAQRQPATGFQAANPYVGGGFDAVNVRNGNVVINLPLASLPKGRGTAPGAAVTLQYNSKLWQSRQTNINDHIQGGQNTYAYTSDTLSLSDRGGWKIIYGYTPLWTDRLNLESPDPCLFGDDVEKLSARWKLEMQMPDGSIHQFMPTNGNQTYANTTRDGYYSTDFNGTGYTNTKLTNPANGLCYISSSTSQGTSGMTYVSNDGSRLRLFVPYVSSQSPSQANLISRNWKLYFLDGTVVENLPPEDSTVTQRITDRNGSKVEIKGNQIIDQIGRSVTIGGAGITVDGVDGHDVTTQLTYGSRYVYRKYKAIGSNDGETVPENTDRWTYLSQEIPVLTQITLPSQAGGQSYYFDYYADTTLHSGTNYTDGWGEIKTVTMPTGATATYNYTLVAGTDSLAGDVLDNQALSKDLAFSESYDGASTTSRIERTLYSSFQGSWSVTSPNGAVSSDSALHYSYSSVWDEGLSISSQAPDGSITERIWKTNLPNYTGVFGTSNFAAGNANAYVKTEFTTVKDSNGQPYVTAIKDFNYDKNGNVTRIAEYDWVAYGSVPRTANRPTAIPSGISPARITVNEYYNQTPDAESSSTSSYTYENPSSPKLKNVIKSTEIRDGSETVKARTEFYYDDADNTGNLTEVRTWDSTKGAVSNPLTTGSSGNAVTSTTTYNSYGSPTLLTDANGIQTQITYGDVAGPNGNVIGLYPTQTILAYGTPIARTSTAVYDFYTGVVTSTTDVDNSLTNATIYDDIGRPTKAITAQGTNLESWTTTEYHDGDRFVVVKSDLETKGDGKKVATQFYDQLGRVRLSKTLEDSTTQSATNETDGIKVQSRYGINDPTPTVSTDPQNSLGSYVITSNPYRANYSAGATGETTMGWTLSYSPKTGKHSDTTTYFGTTVPTIGSTTNSTGVVTTDIDADRTLVTDQAGKQRISRTNALGQLKDIWEVMSASDSSTTSVTFPNQTGIAYGYQTSYSYDTLNNLTAVNQGSQTRTFAYNSLSRLTSAANPESGTITYAYDPGGNLTQKDDARGVRTAYVYDALNRVTNRNYSTPSGTPGTGVLSNYQASPNVTYYYDNVTNAKGKLVKVSSSVSTTEYTSFDILGRVTASKQTTDGVTYGNGSTDSPMTYSYNLSGALIEQQYPSGRVVKNVLDASGDLSIVESRKNASSGYWHYANSFSYNAVGAVTSMQIGNGRWESTQFNSRLQPTQIALGTTQGATDKLKLDYSYGDWNGGSIDATKNNGNIVQQVITTPTVGSSTGFTATQKYYYDPLNRIDDSIETIGGTQTWRQDFTYDRYGNRNFNGTNTTTLPKLCGTSPNFTVCAADKKIHDPAVNVSNNRLSTSDGYAFDNAGNTINDPQLRKFTYDEENKQTKVETVNSGGTVTGTVGEYFYDGDGKRVKKYVPATGETTIFVYDAAGKQIAEYSTVVASATDAKVAYLTADHLGSPRINTDANGAVIARHDYHPYGEEIDGTGGRTTGLNYGSDSVRKQFTSYERDIEADLDYAQARYYNFKHGRFTSVDPLMASADIINPQTFNRYAYVGNNPVNITDPTGEIWGTKDGSMSWYDNEKAMLAAGAVVATQLVGWIGNQLYALNPNANQALPMANPAEAINQLVRWGAPIGALAGSISAAFGVGAVAAAAIAANIACGAPCTNLYQANAGFAGNSARDYANISKGVYGDAAPKTIFDYVDSQGNLLPQYLMNENKSEQGETDPSQAKPNPKDNEPTDHAKQRREEARSGNANRDVGDPNRVVREGKPYRDNETGYTVYVKGNRAVVYDGNRQVTQFKNSRRNTQNRVQSGRWTPLK